MAEQQGGRPERPRPRPPSGPGGPRPGAVRRTPSSQSPFAVLQRRVRQLETRDPTPALRALGERVADLEERLNAGLTALAQRIRSLEDGGSGGGQELDDAIKAFAARIDALERGGPPEWLEAMERKVEKASRRDDAIVGLGIRLAKLEGRIEVLEESARPARGS